MVVVVHMDWGDTLGGSTTVRGEEVEDEGKRKRKKGCSRSEQGLHWAKREREKKRGGG
jgi:hypothetical protein